MLRRMWSLFSLLLIASMLLAACSAAAPVAAPGSSAAAPAAAAGSLALVEWDYYASGDGNAVWGGLVENCAKEVGVTVERQAVPRNELITKVLLAAQQKQMPDVLMIDNPDLQEVAATGALAPLTDYGVDLTGLYKNLLDAGSYEDKVYGIARGINGMALWYNKDMLEAAGVQPPTTWAEVKDAAAKLTTGEVYGIAFSAPATEEGTWQFEPWFWAAGGDLNKLDSPEGIQALQFWTDLVNEGYASKSVVQWSQGDANDQFLAGKAAMQQNGVWNLGAIEKQASTSASCRSPCPKAARLPARGRRSANHSAHRQRRKDGGRANWSTACSRTRTCSPGPTRTPTSPAVIGGPAGGQGSPKHAPFVEAAAAERSRPGPPANLGPNYSKVSHPLWNAIQAALSGARVLNRHCRMRNSRRRA